MVNYTQELNILVVDDVEVHRFLMSSGLLRINPFAKVVQANGVVQAKELLSKPGAVFQVVISDWNMPDGGGAELVKWMRSMAAYKRVPFVMISSHNEQEKIIQAFMDLGVDAYVVKPFTPTALYEKVMKAIEKKQAAAK